MLEKSKYTLLLITLMSLLSFNSRGGDLDKSKAKVQKESTMNMEIIDEYGNVDLMDEVTLADPTLNFDLAKLPIGNYTIQVLQNGELLNSHAIHNAAESKNVITIEILNAKGNQVYLSTNAGDAFDLTQMPKGNYTIKIYQGQDLINSNKISNN